MNSTLGSVVPLAMFHFGLSSSNLAVVALAYNGKVLQLQHLFLQLVLNNFMHLSDSNCPAHGATQLLFLNIIAHRWRLQGSIYISLLIVHYWKWQ